MWIKNCLNGAGLENGQEKSRKGRDGGSDDLHHDRARSRRLGSYRSVSERIAKHSSQIRIFTNYLFIFWVGVRTQGAEKRAVQQVHQSNGRRGEGNPHGGPRALEALHGPYVHTTGKKKPAIDIWPPFEIPILPFLWIQLCQKNTSESVKPSRTSPRCSPAAATKVHHAHPGSDVNVWGGDMLHSQALRGMMSLREI